MEAFPYYLAMGMSAAEFWDQDAALVRAYRKADEIGRERRNFEMWMNGRYAYDALCAASPLFRTSFSRTTIKPEPYMEKPYPISEAQARREKEAEERAAFNRLWADMERTSRETMKKRREAGEEEASTDNGGH